MNTMIADSALISIAEESEQVRQTTQAAGVNRVSTPEIEQAERYFKAMYQIEFLTLII
jgi:hypothetical protein